MNKKKGKDFHTNFGEALFRLTWTHLLASAIIFSDRHLVTVKVEMEMEV